MDAFQWCEHSNETSPVHSGSSVLVDWVRQISSKWKEALLAGCLLGYVAGARHAFFLVFIEHLKGIRKGHSSLLFFSSFFFPQKSWLHKPVTKVSLSPALISHSTVCFLFFPFHKIKFDIFVNIWNWPLRGEKGFNIKLTT